jgi:Inhibitor of vertebrate lysozyme (Ivy)
MAIVRVRSSDAIHRADFAVDYTALYIFAHSSNWLARPAVNTASSVPRRELSKCRMGPKQEQFWVQDMTGSSSALIATVAGGRELVVGQTCRPHDCYDNNLVFAIDLGNKQIWGLRQGRGQSPKAKQFIGSPDPEMQKFLLQTLTNEFPVNP